MSLLMEIYEIVKHQVFQNICVIPEKENVNSNSYVLTISFVLFALHFSKWRCLSFGVANIVPHA